MLNSLQIKNYRLLNDFTVSKLGRVNLIVGKNNAGKSTVLEALRIYAANGQRSVLEQITTSHDAKVRLRSDETESDFDIPFADLFTGRRFPEDNAIINIGELNSSENRLSLQHVYVVQTEDQITDDSGETATRMRRSFRTRTELVANNELATSLALLIKRSNRAAWIDLSNDGPRYNRVNPEITPIIPCAYIPTRFIDQDELAVEWDTIALTNHHSRLKDAMKIIAPDFEDLVFVHAEDNPLYPRRSARRTAKLKMSGQSHPVPLSSMGDGMLRLLQLTLKIFPAQGGFLLIDEFENGLHYTIQEKVWALVFELAMKLDIQVFATTHSWDCIKSYARIVHQRTDVEGVLFRVGKSALSSNTGQVIATVFDESQIDSITESEIEVR